MNLLVDGNNVMGSRPDGWWRDPAAAARRLLTRLQCLAATRDGTITVVFDVPRPDLPAGEHDGVVVQYAIRRGRDAADDRIRDLLTIGGAGDVEVVTSDRALAADARAFGARVTGAGSFLAELDQAGC